MTASLGIYRSRRPASVKSMAAIVAWEHAEARPEGECLVSGLKTGTHGYPQTRYRGRPAPLHQLVAAVHHGPRHENLEVRHLCGNKRCVQPGHLVYGTSRDNKLDWHAHKRGAGPLVKTIMDGRKKE